MICTQTLIAPEDWKELQAITLDARKGTKERSADPAVAALEERREANNMAFDDKWQRAHGQRPAPHTALALYNQPSEQPRPEINPQQEERQARLEAASRAGHCGTAGDDMA